MIANRVMDYLNSEGLAVDEHQLDVAARICRESLKRNLGGDRETGDRKIRMPRPSSTLACRRRLVFDSLGLDTKRYDGRARLTFTHGDMTEAMGVLLYRQAMTMRGEAHRIISPDLDGRQLEMTATLDPADWGVDGAPFSLTGHVDMTIMGHGDHEEIVDWKSSSRYAFQNMEAAASKPDHKWWEKERLGYIAQVRLYMMLNRALKRGPGDRGYLVFVCKDTGHIAEVLIPSDYDREREVIVEMVKTLESIEGGAEKRAIVLTDRRTEGDEASDEVLANWVHTNVSRPHWAEASVTTKTGATRRPDGTKGPCLEVDAKATPNSWRCTYCPHPARCWPEFSVVALAGGPVLRTNTP